MGKWLSEVRAHMRFADMPQRSLALRLNKGKNYVNECMTGKRAFTTDEAHEIMDMFGIPRERMHELFPPLPAKQAKRQKAG